MEGFRRSLRLFITAFLLLMDIYCTAQVKELPVSKVDSSMYASPKPLLILLSTDWCKYCQMQKKQLCKNKDFQAEAEKLYFVVFDAEYKDSLTFQGQPYRYKATGISTGIHELAVALSGSKAVSFPTWVLLDKDYQLLFRYNGVLSPGRLKEILKTLEEMSKEKI